MTAFDRSGRLLAELPDVLTDLAAPHVPDYVDDVLAVTAATRQRPRWTFPERWLPMGVIATERMAVPARFSLRTLALVALLIAALVGGALVIAGSQRHVPPPFGPARNGAIVFGDGDIAIRDTIDGPSTLLVGGTTDDFGANFTRDGSHLVWLRRLAGTPGSADERLAFMVADADGSNIRQVTDGLDAPDWWDISPDGSNVIAQVADPQLGTKLVAIDLVGNAGVRSIDVGDPSMTLSIPDYIGPNGNEIVFRGETSTAAGVRAGVFAANPDGTGLRPLTPTDGAGNAFYQNPVVSPDGRFLTYTNWDGQLNSIHLVNLKTGADRLTDPGTSRNQGFASFSPDTRYLLFVVDDGPWYFLMIEPVDGSAPARQVGPKYLTNNGSDLSGRFSPDGRSILISEIGAKESRLVDVDAAGDGRVVEYAPSDTNAWQRLAP